MDRHGPDELDQASLAYENNEFLNSPDGRMLRIMAEYQEPMTRFRRERIQDTVVFFGSARFRALDVASSELDPQGLSVPELYDYLRYNSDFPAPQLAPYRTHLADRFALPFACFVVVLIAAPLGIVYNRTGVALAVAGALCIFFGMILAHGFFNVLIGRALRKRGWRRTMREGYKYWSTQRFERF